MKRQRSAGIAPLLSWSVTSIRMTLVLRLASPPLHVNPPKYCIINGYLPRGKDRPKGDGAAKGIRTIPYGFCCFAQLPYIRGKTNQLIPVDQLTWEHKPCLRLALASRYGSS